MYIRGGRGGWVGWWWVGRRRADYEEGEGRSRLRLVSLMFLVSLWGPSLRNSKARVHVQMDEDEEAEEEEEDVRRTTRGYSSPSSGGGVNEKGMKRGWGTGAPRSLGSHTYINVACQAYRAIL